MVSSADRKNWSFSLLVFSRKGACHGVALFPQNRTNHENLLPDPSPEGPAALRCGRGCQTRAWRDRLHFRPAGLRSKDHSARLGRSPTTARTATRLGPKKRGGRKRLIDTQPQLQTNFHM